MPLSEIRLLQDRGQEVALLNKSLRDELKLCQEERSLLAAEVGRQIKQELYLKEKIRKLEEEIGSKGESLAEFIESVQQSMRLFEI